MPVSARVLSTIDPAPEPDLGYGELQAQLLLDASHSRTGSVRSRMRTLPLERVLRLPSGPRQRFSLGAHSRWRSRAAS